MFSTEILLEQLLHRLPSLQTAEVKQFVNGPESFTPDGRYILGHAPEVFIIIVGIMGKFGGQESAVVGKVRWVGKFGGWESSVGGKVWWEGTFGGRESSVAGKIWSMRKSIREEFTCAMHNVLP